MTKDLRALLLAAGKGTRLLPFTENWPKCLMPIGDRPLLEYWLDALCSANVSQALVNLHHHADLTREFLERPRFIDWVQTVHEPELLGTAGTLRANLSFFQGGLTLLVHADNWCQCDFSDFLDFHFQRRPADCPITMMTFESPTPQTCGIVETDEEGIVKAFHEKVADPPSNLANAAVYLLEPEVLDWVEANLGGSDFSTAVLPNFMGRIATWRNEGIHRDVGAIESLQAARRDFHPPSRTTEDDTWQRRFLTHPIHRLLAGTGT